MRKTSMLTISRLDAFESFQEVHREMFAFEIKTFVGDFKRSYFVRVESQQECEEWIAAVNKCLKKTLREYTDKHSWIEKQQRSARTLQSRHGFRCLIAFLLLADFLSCVFKSEFLPEPGGAAHAFFQALDAGLFVLFCLELLLTAFGHWRSPAGAPFTTRLSSWFQVATVAVQGLAFLDPAIASLKVVRVVRIFDVGSAFRSLASCHMILKAIRQGHTAPPPHPTLPSYPGPTLRTMLVTGWSRGGRGD